MRLSEYGLANPNSRSLKTVLAMAVLQPLTFHFSRVLGLSLDNGEFVIVNYLFIMLSVNVLVSNLH